MTCAQSRCLRAIAGALLVAAAAFAQDPHVEFKNGVLSIVPWTGGSAFPEVRSRDSETPVPGTWTQEGGALVFHPQSPLRPSVQYRIVLKTGTFPADPLLMPDPLPGLKVAQVYPSANVLPANILRFYVYFTAPMQRGGALEHIRLVEAGGNPVPSPFLDEELWDPENRRLTLLLDPGRIKRGIANELGPVLVEGKQYRLLIDWFEKDFTAGPPERTAADPKLWKIQAPRAGTSEPLIVDFPRAMDYSLMQRMIAVSGMRGSVAVDKDETRWIFTPAVPWTAGEWRLVADNNLEDIAGNHLDRAFDLDAAQRRRGRKPSVTTSLSFRVR